MRMHARSHTCRWSAHKLLAFCMDRGNLPTAGTPAQVAFQLLLPAAFIAKEGTGESGAAVLARRLQEPARTLFLRGLAKLGTVMAFVLVLTRMRGGLHAVLNPCGGHAATKLGLPVCDWTAAPEQRMANAPHVQLMMFSWIIFMFISLVMDLPAALLQRIDVRRRQRWLVQACGRSADQSTRVWGHGSAAGGVRITACALAGGCDGGGVIARACARLQSGAVMMPHFDEPYLSTSGQWVPRERMAVPDRWRCRRCWCPHQPP